LFTFDVINWTDIPVHHQFSLAYIHFLSFLPCRETSIPEVLDRMVNKFKSLSLILHTALVCLLVNRPTYIYPPHIHYYFLLLIISSYTPPTTLTSINPYNPLFTTCTHVHMYIHLIHLIHLYIYTYTTSPGLSYAFAEF
jgi:hypothetical protein